MIYSIKQPAAFVKPDNYQKKQERINLTTKTLTRPQVPGFDSNVPKHKTNDSRLVLR